MHREGGEKPGSVPCSYSIAAEAFQQKSQHRAYIPFVSKMDHQAMEWLQRNACIMPLTFCYSQNRSRGGKNELWMSTSLRLYIFFLLVHCEGRFPVGIWEAGAVPVPSHTFEKSQRVYIRDEQEVKEIVNSSEMLQGRLDAGGQTHKSGMLLLKSGSFQKTRNVVKALSFVCQFQTFQHMLLILFLILTVHPETIHGNCGYCNTI